MILKISTIPVTTSNFSNFLKWIATIRWQIKKNKYFQWSKITVNFIIESSLKYSNITVN